MNKDFQVIEEALQGKRFTQLQCKRYDVDTAKKELNEDVCVEHKRLNHYIHQKVSDIIMIHLNLCLGMPHAKTWRSQTSIERLQLAPRDKLRKRRP